MNRAYVSAPACGNVPKQGEGGVIISFWGPKGGTRSIEEVSPEDARKLARDLLAAADEAEEGR